MKEYTLPIIGYGFVLAFIVTVITLSVMWTDRSLDYVATLIKGSPVDVPMWISAIASLFAPIGLFFNLCVEFLRLVM